MTRKTAQSDDPVDDGGAGRLRISLRQVEVFVATARAGTTRGAAQRVARSQSAASAALVELEAAVGVPLFDRVRRRLVLNENGRSLLPRASALLERAGEVERLFAAEHAVPLRIAASLTIGEVLLPDLVARWKALHPGSTVHITVGNTSQVIRTVADFGVDLGFIEGPRTHPDLRIDPWLVDEMVVVAAPAHPLARARSVSATRLRAATWAAREAGSGSREAVDRWAIEHLGGLDVGFELGSTEAIRRVVLSGAAIACMSRLTVADALAERRLVELRTGLPRAQRQLAMVVHRDKQLGRGTGDFVAHCRAAAAPSGATRGAR